MPHKSSKSQVPTRPTRPDLYASLRDLLRTLDQPLEPRKTGPGRPAKIAPTAPVILHLYKSQIQWLDDYAALIQSRRPDNMPLTRVEIVRGLLLGLARFALEQDIPFPDQFPVKSERDLQYAIAAALHPKR